MNKKICCVLPFAGIEVLNQTIRELKTEPRVTQIIVVAPEMSEANGVKIMISPGGLHANVTWKKLLRFIDADYLAVYTKTLPLRLGQYALERMLGVAEDTDAGMVYADYYEQKENVLMPHPLIDCQFGSLRDDFNFGSLMLFRTAAVKTAVDVMDDNYNFAALYDLRLKVSQHWPLAHLPELLYTEMELDTRKSGEKMFDYVDPRNRSRQLEMEQACTSHLKAIGGWLAPKFRKITFDEKAFSVEVSVIIPVRNRVKTIADAIESVLKQKAPFNFNLIIVDNHSTDGTTELIRSFTDNRIVHVIPERKDLGIGGCWNEGVAHEKCGKFSIQLDSDDLYIDETVLVRIVEAFYKQQCAMVVGSYQMVNFKLEEIPPGLIDHREWTSDNGRNNALRINGLGAPRAFYTPILRAYKLPNTSYGEDYALGLRISRHYQIGRIYEPLYLCRRWEENSDASLDIAKLNAHNFYKDKLRTIELIARQQYVKNGQPV